MDNIFDSDTFSDEEVEKEWAELQNMIRDLKKINESEKEK
jgi:hypothetical protein